MNRNLNRHTPILVPYSDWDKSVNALKWLEGDEYLRQVNLIAIILQSVVSERDDLSVRYEATWIEDREAAQMLTTMWLGYEWHLALYGMRLASVPRYKTLGSKISVGTFQRYYVNAKRTEPPYWFGSKTLHESHQCWLIRHDGRYSHTFGHKMARASDVLPLCWPPHHPHKIKYT